MIYYIARPVSQVVKTSPSHGEDRGSTPLRVTNNKVLDLLGDFFFIITVFRGGVDGLRIKQNPPSPQRIFPLENARNEYLDSDKNKNCTAENTRLARELGSELFAECNTAKAQEKRNYRDK